jgi:hypothetical protein
VLVPEFSVESLKQSHAKYAEDEGDDAQRAEKLISEDFLCKAILHVPDGILKDGEMLIGWGNGANEYIIHDMDADTFSDNDVHHIWFFKPKIIGESYWLPVDGMMPVDSGSCTCS